MIPQSFESHFYWEDVAAVELQQRLLDINVLFNKDRVSIGNSESWGNNGSEEIGKINLNPDNFAWERSSKTAL